MLTAGGRPRHLPTSNEGMEMRVAKYKSLKNDYTTIDSDGWMDNPDNGYLRTTEFVEVEFIDLPPEQTVPQEVAALEAVKKAAAVKYHSVVMALDEKISKLLAITHES